MNAFPGEKSTGGPPEPMSVVLPGTRDARDADRSLTPVGHGYTREEIAELQKDRLRDAIVQVVSEDGFENASIKAICSRAGVGLATFYEHFHSKNDLMFAAYDAGVTAVFEVVSARYAAPADGADIRERTESGTLALLEVLAANPAFARFFLVEFPKSGAEAHDRIEAALDAAFELFTDVEPDGGLEAPDPEMVPLVVGGIYAHLSRYVRTGRTAELPNLLPSLLQFSQASIGGFGASTINLKPPH